MFWRKKIRVTLARTDLSTILEDCFMRSVVFVFVVLLLFRKMAELLQKKFNSLLLRKKKIIQIFVVVFLLSMDFYSSSFAKEETHYIKGLGAVLREQPSIQGKTLTKLPRGTEVHAIETKGIWHKVESGEKQGWILRGQITKVPVKIKKLTLGQKIRLNSASGRRVRLRTFTAVVGVKGLVDSKGEKISPYQTDYVALEWLEKQPTDEENSVRFLTLSE